MAQRFEGRNLDEALQSAATALGAERYQLTYHVVLEKRGFLGGSKHVVIEAELNEAASPAEAAAAAAPVVSAPERTREPRGPRRSAGGGGGGREGGGRDRGGRGRGRGDRPRRDDRQEFVEEGPPVDVPPQGPESEAAASVRAWCEQLIGLSKLSLTVRSEENDTQIILRLFGRDATRLIDRNGELLDALQVLANKALTGRKVEKDIELDCAAFKERRVEELGQQARATADRVRRDKREQLLPAMTPIERRIVHLALQDDADVTTESRGDGFFKRVAIILRPASTESTPES
jgi:spoIIIJ-associated protein